MQNLFLALAISALFISCQSNSGKNKSNSSDDASKAESSSQEQKTASSSEMVYFEGGTFPMGSATGSQQEQPVHQVEVK